MALLMTLPVSLPIPGLKSRSGASSGRGLAARILIGVGGLAAALATFTLYRNRARSRTGAASRTRRNSGAPSASARAPSTAPIAAPALEQASMDWILAGRGMDTLVPAAYSIPLPETQEAGQGEGNAHEVREPWLETLRKAMEHKPLKFGYDKSVWTAPLLGHYLQESHGVSVTPTRLRGALKDLGYHWKHTHYAPIRPGTRHH